jgi:ATP-dependent Clp protease ATP-binding subunit ClpA
MERIVDLQMDEVQKRLAEHGLTVEISEAARSWLANEGYDPDFGARPLKRALQKYIESPLSVKILQGEYKDGDSVLVDYIEDEGVVFRSIERGTPVKLEEEVSA